MYGKQLPATGQVPPGPAVGPWDDIMCWFPAAGERQVPLKEADKVGHLKYHEPGSFGSKAIGSKTASLARPTMHMQRSTEPKRPTVRADDRARISPSRGCSGAGSSTAWHLLGTWVRGAAC